MECDAGTEAERDPVETDIAAESEAAANARWTRRQKLQQLSGTGHADEENGAEKPITVGGGESAHMSFRRSDLKSSGALSTRPPFSHAPRLYGVAGVLG